MDGEPEPDRPVESAPLIDTEPESVPIILPDRRRSLLEWFADSYEGIIFGLLVFEYVFVQLIFTTYGQNIVLLKDIAGILCPILIMSIWLVGDFCWHGKFLLPRHGIVTATVAALVYWAALVFVSPSTPDSIYTWLFYWSNFVLVWALLKVLDSPKRLMIVLRTVLVCNALMIVYGWTQLVGADVLVMFGIIPDWGSNVFVSTYGSPNFFSGYMIITVPILIGYWFLTRNIGLRIFLPLLVVFNLYEIVKSTARGAYVAMVWYLVVYPILLTIGVATRAIARDYDWKRIITIGAIVLLVFAVFCAVAVPDETKDFGILIYQQFYTLWDFERNYTNWVRIVFFQMALDGGLRAPTFGRGLGMFNYQMPETRPIFYHRTGVSHNTDHPHNEHLEWLHDTGVPGLAFFWTILAAYAVLGIRGIRRHRGGIFHAFLLSAFMGPWNEWYQSTFDVESRWSSPALTLWFGVGLVLAVARLPRILARAALAEACSEPRPEPPAPTGSPYLGLLIIACAIPMVFACVMVYRFWMADHHLRNNMAFTDASQGSALAALAEAEEARRLCYANPSNYYKLAYTYLVAGRMNDAMESYRDLQAFAPNYAQIHINLAFLDDQLGNRTASAWERDRAATIEHNIKNHRDAAQYWVTLGDTTRALAHMRQCFTIELERTEAGYYYWYDQDDLRAEMARIYMSTSDTPAAETELRQALALNPDNVLAGVLLSQLCTGSGDNARATELEATLQTLAPNNPALLVLKMSRAVAAKDYDLALQLADEVSSTLSLPTRGAQPSQEAANLGNSLLSMLQVINVAKYDPDRTLALAGWVYAIQGRDTEAEQFLSSSFSRTHDPRTADRLGQVRARKSGG